MVESIFDGVHELLEMERFSRVPVKTKLKMQVASSIVMERYFMKPVETFFFPIMDSLVLLWQTLDSLKCSSGIELSRF